jgi:dethiobiotin synthetase
MILLITGTDTGVGKTITTAALTVRYGGAVPTRPAAPPAVHPADAAAVARAAEAAGATADAPGVHPADAAAVARAADAAATNARGGRGGTVVVVKPAQTGVAADEPGDLDDVHRLTGLLKLHEGVRLRDPLAPTTAARRESVVLPPIAAHAKAIDELAQNYDTVLVEGAGGILVGLDAEGNNLADLAAHLTTPFGFVVVARAGLGTLNHAGLTVEALRTRNLPIEGIVIGSWPAEPDLAEQCNLEDLPVVTGVPIIAQLPANAGDLDRDAFITAAPTWFK